jgi:hypothetical protein
MSAPARPGGRHRHIVLIVTTRILAIGHKAQRGSFGSYGAPSSTQ